MIAAPPLEQINYRLAQYYLEKLRAAEAAYEYGHEHSDYALALFASEWHHIQQWQHWAATHANDNHLIATLCKAYSQVGYTLLSLRQHPQERLQWLEAGLAAAQQLSDVQAEMIHLYRLGKIHHMLGAMGSSQDCLEKALALAQQLDNSLYVSKILIAFGNMFYSKGEYAQAQTALEQALNLSKAIDAKREEGIALNGLGSVAFLQSNYTQAYNCLTQALALYEMHGLPHNLCTVLDDLSNLMLQMGDAGAAKAYAERGIVVAQAISDQKHLTLAWGLLGNLAKARQDFVEAKAYFQKSLDAARLLGRPSPEVLAWLRLGSLLMETGDLAPALECFEAALSIPKMSSFYAYKAIALMGIARVFRMMGDISNACLNLHDGLEIALAIKSPMIQTWYLLEAAWLWHDCGQLEQATSWTVLLSKYSHELDNEQQTILDELNHQLKTKLEHDRYNWAIELGETLELESVISAIFEELLESLKL